MDHSSGLVFRRPQATLTADLWSIFAPPFSHLIGGGAYERESLLIDVEVFTKDLSDLTQFAPRFVTASDEIDYDDFFYHGEGTARGGEVLVQKRTGRHTGWVAYTLSKVEELFPGLEPDPFPATHDQRHEVKIVSFRLHTTSGTR